jgi:hypothetical protein
MSERKKPPAIPDDVKGDLSSLWHSALGHIDEIRDVIVRGSHAGKARLDGELLKRQRDKLLMHIGLAVIDDHKRGAPLPPSCDEYNKKLEEIERQLREANQEVANAFAKNRD